MHMQISLQLIVVINEGMASLIIAISTQKHSRTILLTLRDANNFVFIYIRNEVFLFVIILMFIINLKNNF